MYLVKTPVLISKLMSKSLVWNIPTKEKKIYLTFDDGPIPELTEEILQILTSYQAKATFFCVGENAQRYPHLLAKILDDDHLIGNHSQQHISGWKTATKDYIENVHQASESIKSSLFRPPYGQINYQQIKSLKKDFKIIMWSLLSGDFDTGLTKQQCLFNALQSKPGDIIVFHDNIKAKEKISYVLPRYLEHFSKMGYEFCSLKHLINEDNH
jgi:peptidoglycan/xylan/chitin deacetylase (PgdA/CDA1 family)